MTCYWRKINFNDWLRIPWNPFIIVLFLYVSHSHCETNTFSKRNISSMVDYSASKQRAYRTGIMRTRKACGDSNLWNSLYCWLAHMKFLRETQSTRDSHRMQLTKKLWIWWISRQKQLHLVLSFRTLEWCRVPNRKCPNRTLVFTDQDESHFKIRP